MPASSGIFLLVVAYSHQLLLRSLSLSRWHRPDTGRLRTSFRLASPATVYFQRPEPPTAANLRVLVASSREKQGTQAGTHDFPKREKVVHNNKAAINLSRFIYLFLYRCLQNCFVTDYKETSNLPHQFPNLPSHLPRSVVNIGSCRRNHKRLWASRHKTLSPVIPYSGNKWLLCLSNSFTSAKIIHSCLKVGVSIYISHTSLYITVMVTLYIQSTVTNFYISLHCFVVKFLIQMFKSVHSLN